MVVADMPLLEVESNRAGSTCCKTCSKENVTHGNGGVFLSPDPAKLVSSTQATVALSLPAIDDASKYLLTVSRHASLYLNEFAALMHRLWTPQSVSHRRFGDSCVYGPLL